MKAKLRVTRMVVKQDGVHTPTSTYLTNYKLVSQDLHTHTFISAEDSWSSLLLWGQP